MKDQLLLHPCSNCFNRVYEAEIAGNIPDINPIAANPVPRIIFPALKTNSKSNALVKIREIIQTKDHYSTNYGYIIASNKN
jgi:hypothetical protein